MAKCFSDYDQARLLDRHIRKIEENHPGEVVHLLASYNFEYVTIKKTVQSNLERD